MTMPAPSAPAAAIYDAFKIYGKGDSEVRALDGVSMAVARGEFLAIMGPSGSGKSTLMHCMAGLDRLTAGAAFIGGTEISSLGEAELTKFRGRRVGFIFQSFNLLPTLSAEENIRLPLDLAKEAVDRDRASAIYSALGISDRLRHKPSELSGGQQQRVAIARALLPAPDVVFGDEPTGNLDSKASADVLTMLRRAADDYHQTVVIVTHDPAAAATADRVVFLRDGRLISELRSPTTDRVLDLLKSLGD
jgi:putative ABC transport system ATP-binding protein